MNTLAAIARNLVSVALGITAGIGIFAAVALAQLWLLGDVPGACFGWME